jgi:hypothetical protein
VSGYRTELERRVRAQIEAEFRYGFATDAYVDDTLRHMQQHEFLTRISDVLSDMLVEERIDR